MCNISYIYSHLVSPGFEPRIYTLIDGPYPYLNNTEDRNEDKMELVKFGPEK